MPEVELRRAGFPPVARADAKVLILGSLPGAESLRQGRYYAHKANRFWWIMGELLGASPDLPYADRLERLVGRRIALWDVCAAASRPGSLDANILPASVVVNDFDAFLAGHRSLRLICFNGGSAFALFRARVPISLPGFIRCERLPSTSSAHAAMRPEQKLARWRAALGEFIALPAGQ